MMIGYFDESYNQANATNHGLPLVYTVAGYLAEDHKWEVFGERWQGILDKHKLPPFSMKEFVNPHSRVYGSWEQRDREILEKELIQIIRDTYLQSFSTSVILADYEELSDFAKYAFGKPHGYAAINCFKHITRWADGAGIRERIWHVFEDGAVDAGPFRSWTETIAQAEQEGYKIENVSFESKAKPQLQAADMLAWQNRKETGRRLLSPSKKARVRPWMFALHDPKRDQWFTAGRAQFKKN